MMERGLTQERPTIPGLDGPENPAGSLAHATAGLEGRVEFAPESPGEDFLDAFSGALEAEPEPEPAREAAYVTSPVRFQEVAPTSLKVDSQKMLKAAALAIGMVLPAAAAPQHKYPSEEARLLAKLQMQDRTMEEGRRELARMEARRMASLRDMGIGSIPAPEVTAPVSGDDGKGLLAGSVAIAGAFSLTMLINASMKLREQKKKDPND